VKKKGCLKRIAAVILTVIMMLSMACVPAFAAANEAVNKDKTGVIMIMTGTKDLDGNVYGKVQAGTGFLINETTVVTCNHVVVLDSDYIKQACQDLNMSEKQVKERQYIEVSVVRDVTIPATVKTNSVNMDIAVLELKQQLLNRETLALRSSSTVKSTETCYSLGFPSTISDYDNKTTYTSDDVTVTTGQVNKVSAVNAGPAPVDYVISSAKIENGNSGGPLVDEAGHVIGICQAVLSNDGFDSDYYYSIAIDQLIDMIKPLGIQYTSSDEPAIAPEPDSKTTDVTPEPVKPVNTDALATAIEKAKEYTSEGYTEDSFAALSSAVDDAEKVLGNKDATQDEVNAAAQAVESAIGNLVVPEPTPGLPMGAIIGIIAAVAALIAVIIILATRKQPQAPQAQPVGPLPTPVGPVAPNVQPPADYQGGMPTGVLNQGSSETTVLSGGGETTVLSQNAVSYGKLIRKKSGETVNVTSPEFKIGRNRATVDYCVADNTAVGRVHAIVVSKNGNTYLKDNNSTNGTFVNNVRVKSGSETLLANGDKITLGDEEFTYEAF